MELQLLYRDEDLVVIDKPAGLLVHRSGLDAHETDTVLDRLSPPAYTAGSRSALVD